MGVPEDLRSGPLANDTHNVYLQESWVVEFTTFRLLRTHILSIAMLTGCFSFCSALHPCEFSVDSFQMSGQYRNILDPINRMSRTSAWYLNIYLVRKMRPTMAGRSVPRIRGSCLHKDRIIMLITKLVVWYLCRDCATCYDSDYLLLQSLKSKSSMGIHRTETSSGLTATHILGLKGDTVRNISLLL